MSDSLSDTEALYAISEATNDDGTVDAVLAGFERSNNGDTVTVCATLPTGATIYESMDWPQSDDASYKFVRIFEEAGYGIVGADEACEDGATVRVDPETEQFVAPEPVSITRRIMQLFPTVFGIRDHNGDEILSYVLFYPLFLMVSIILLEPDQHPFKQGFGVSSLGALFWVLIFVSPLILL